MKKLVILGAGTAGTMMANKLQLNSIRTFDAELAARGSTGGP